MKNTLEEAKTALDCNQMMEIDPRDYLELYKIANSFEEIVEQFMSNIAHCADIDFGLLNETLMRFTKLKKQNQE